MFAFQSSDSVTSVISILCIKLPSQSLLNLTIIMFKAEQQNDLGGVDGAGSLFSSWKQISSKDYLWVALFDLSQYGLKSTFAVTTTEIGAAATMFTTRMRTKAGSKNRSTSYECRMAPSSANKTCMYASSRRV